VAQRPGTRHPVTAGAPGKAILTVLPHAQWPDDVSDRLRAEVADAVSNGYATSHDEVIPSLRSVSVPLSLRGRRPSAIAVVYVASAHEPAEIAARLQRSADVIRDALGG
jgi:DNA-binding IclR family transcriptional regulator